MYVRLSMFALVGSKLRDCLELQDQTPPKRELKVSDPKVRDLSLAELQLAPSSVLHVKFEKEELNSK